MSDDELTSLWREFGKNMNLVAILTVLSFITGITAIIAVIFLFIALGNIKMINYRLNSNYLDDFRSKYITSFVLKLIIIPFLVGGILLIVFPVFSSGHIFPDIGYYGFYWMDILIGVIPLVLAFILFIVSFSIEMKAWENLRYFLEQNRTMFPDYVAREAIDGAEKLRTGALLYALGFLAITAIVGFILQVIGFFKLAKFENISSPIYKARPVAPQPPQPPQAPIPPAPSVTPSPYAMETKVVGTRPKFCPNCGAELKDEGKFCPDCGSKIN